MPTDDARLTRAFHDAAPVVDAGGVLDRVAARRTRRRRTRRAGAVAAALAIVIVVVATTVLVTRSDTTAPHVAAPGAGLSARVVTGDDASAGGQDAVPQAVALDTDPGVLLAPVDVGAAAVSVASHDRGTDGVPLTHVVRIDGAHVVDVVNFKAPILSITEGEGARWALTRNPRAVGTRLPDTFLKRIGAVGDPVSVMLPTDSDPVGPVAAVGGAVWVPVRDGVLQFASDTGAYVRHIPLAPAATRVVALLGKGATVTDGVHLLRLDQATGTTTPVLTGTDPFVGLDGRTGWYLVRRDGQVVLDGPDPGRGHTIPQLPAGFAATAFGSSPTRTWVTGTVAGAPAIVLLGDDSVRATVVLGNAHDAAFAWTDARTVTAVTDGRLFTISLP